MELKMKGNTLDQYLDDILMMGAQKKSLYLEINTTF
jgi:hypothetical protein